MTKDDTVQVKSACQCTELVSHDLGVSRLARLGHKLLVNQCVQAMHCTVSGLASHQ